MGKLPALSVMGACALALAACGPNSREQAADHAAKEAALAAGVAARQAPAAPAAPAEPPGAPAATAGATPEAQLVRFACADGSEVQLRYTPAATVAVLTAGGTTVELPEEKVDKGVRYASGDTAVSGEGTLIRLERAGAPPVECRIVTTG